MDVRGIPQPVEGARPFFSLTPGLAARTVASLVLTTAGMYYLSQGKKTACLEKMVLGALLALAGIYVFF